MIVISLEDADTIISAEKLDKFHQILIYHANICDLSQMFIKEDKTEYIMTYDTVLCKVCEPVRIIPTKKHRLFVIYNTITDKSIKKEVIQQVAAKDYIESHNIKQNQLDAVPTLDYNNKPTTCSQCHMPLNNKRRYFYKLRFCSSVCKNSYYNRIARNKRKEKTHTERDMLISNHFEERHKMNITSIKDSDICCGTITITITHFRISLLCDKCKHLIDRFVYSKTIHRNTQTNNMDIDIYDP